MHLCPPIERLGWRRDFHLMHLWKQMKPHMDETKDNCKQRKAGKSRKHGFIRLISLGIETFCHQKHFLASNFELSTRFAILQNATRHSSRCYNLRINTSNQTKMIGFLWSAKKKHWIWVRIWFGLGLPSRNAYAPYTASKLQVSIWFPYHFSPYHYWISNARLTSQKKMKGIRKNPDAWNLLGYISRLSPSSPKKTWTIWAPRHRLPRFCCTVTCR